MKRLQACIYKDFTYKFLWLQVFDEFYKDFVQVKKTTSE